MKKIPEIVFGFSDAENYRRRDNKDLFSRIFLKTAALEQLDKRSTFFLVGEKGTGKTAYAVYYSNNRHNNNVAVHKFIRETDYQKFISLRENNNLALSEYTDIWKVIIFLIVAETIYSSVGTAAYLRQYPKFRALKEAIDEYYDHAFSPEIATALQFVENSERAAEIMAKYVGVGGGAKISTKTTATTNDKKFQTHLLAIERTFREAIGSLRLSDSHILFIDGIDIRPASVPYPQYLDCVKGLANAVWSVNNDFFPNIRDSAGRMRVVLLLRPDIFNSLGLQNRNTKLKDNAVVLDWRTVYYSHRSSDLFKMADRMFSAQQDQSYAVGICWDHYFPFDATNVRADEQHATSFVALMRYSFHRPRDILTILDVLRSRYSDPTGERVFDYKDLFDSEFKRVYGDYLLGEIKDSLSFYYDEDEFETFLKFFEFLDGKQKFDFAKYISAFEEFEQFLGDRQKDVPDFMRTPEEFLQFLFDQNIVSYIEHTADERFIRWCFIERTPSNISPKVKTGLEYEIHYGLANALNTGKEIKSNGRNVLANLRYRKGKPARSLPTASPGKRNSWSGATQPKASNATPARHARNPRVAEVVPEEEGQTPSANSSGSIKFIDRKNGFGFIKQAPGAPDVHFRLSAVTGGGIRRGQRVEFQIVDMGGGKTTAVDIRPMK